MVSASLLLIVLAAGSATALDSHSIRLGDRIRAEWDQLLTTAAVMLDRQQQSSYLSAALLGLPYCENTLVGGVDILEQLVLDLSRSTVSPCSIIFKRSAGRPIFQLPETG